MMTNYDPSVRAGAGWRAKAACQGVEPELFFPLYATRGSKSPREIAAKRVCERCPVITECLTWALCQGEDWGIWGGLSEHERRRLRASRLSGGIASRAGDV